MPNVKNFAYSTVLTAPSPATSGTSLVVQSGDGAKFPSVSFNATIWPAGVRPTSANAEVVTVTAISTDTLTITRAQESSSARTVIVGDQIAATITGALFPTGTIVGTTDAQTVSGKILSDTYMGKGFDTRITQQTTTLGASNDYIADDSLENSASYVLEVPSTSTLEVVPFVSPTLVPQIASGWLNGGGTWTFVSSTTMTVPIADATNMASGTKLQLFQSGVKYFYVTAIAGNLLTINGGTDYTLANSAISAPYYSNFDTPVGFPQWFNYTPTTVGWAATPTTSGTRFCIKGREVTFRYIVSGTSNATNTTVSLPVTTQTSAITGTFSFEGTLGLAQDSSTIQTTAHRQVIDPSANTGIVSCYHDMATAAWTATGTKTVRGTAIYEI